MGYRRKRTVVSFTRRTFVLGGGLDKEKYTVVSFTRRTLVDFHGDGERQWYDSGWLQKGKENDSGWPCASDGQRKWMEICFRWRTTVMCIDNGGL